MNKKTLRKIAIVNCIFFGFSSFFYLRDAIAYNIADLLTILVMVMFLISIATLIFTYTNKEKDV